MRTIGLALFLGVTLNLPASAQSQVTVPEDAKFLVQIDIGAFAETKLGSKILKLTQKMATEELGSDEAEFMQKIEETLGFNPLEEVQTLTVVGSDYEDPEEDLSVVLQMRKTTGNLEGMMLGLPGYESTEEGDLTIHSAKQDDMKAFAAIHEADDGNKRIVVATSKSNLMDLLSPNDAASRFQRQVSWTVPEGTFAQLQIIKFPEEMMDVDAARNVVKLLENVSLLIGEKGSNFTADLLLTTTSDKKAEQIQQLVQGLKAMVGLFEDEIGDDEEAKMALELLKGVKIKRDGKSVSIAAKVPEEIILHFLREEADLPL